MNGSGTSSVGSPGAEGFRVVDHQEAARERQSHVRHELRAPLAVMYPLLSLLLGGGAGELTPQQREYLEVLDRNVVRLEALITGVAASGWADCSAAPWTPAAVVLGEVADELVGLRAVEGAQGPPIRVEAATPPGLRAWADREDVRQILAGLVRNAVAYARRRGGRRHPRDRRWRHGQPGGAGCGARHPSRGAGPGLRVRLPRRAGTRTSRCPASGPGSGSAGSSRAATAAISGSRARRGRASRLRSRCRPPLLPRREPGLLIDRPARLRCPRGRACVDVMVE